MKGDEFKTTVECPENCGGTLRVVQGERFRYFFRCSECPLEGEWEHFAAQIHPARQRQRGR